MVYSLLYGADMYKVIYELAGIRYSEYFGSEWDMDLFLITLPDDANIILVGLNVKEK
jgi:hypothetical protein